MADKSEDSITVSRNASPVHAAGWSVYKEGANSFLADRSHVLNVTALGSSYHATTLALFIATFGEETGIMLRLPVLLRYPCG